MPLSVEHLCYERWTLLATRQKFSATEWAALDRVSKNVYVESHAIYARNLTEFLFGSKLGHVVQARHYVPTWKEKPSGSLGRALGRVAIEIAHLSYDRANVRPEDKPWGPELASEIDSVLKRWLAQAAEPVQRTIREWEEKHGAQRSGDLWNSY